MTIPLPFTWPYAVVFWPIYVRAFVPEFRIVNRATGNSACSRLGAARA